MSSLSDAQKLRMAENKRKALAIRAAKNLRPQMQQPQQTNQQLHGHQQQPQIQQPCYQQQQHPEALHGLKPLLAHNSQSVAGAVRIKDPYTTNSQSTGPLRGSINTPTASTYKPTPTMHRHTPSTHAPNDTSYKPVSHPASAAVTTTSFYKTNAPPDRSAALGPSRQGATSTTSSNSSSRDGHSNAFGKSALSAICTTKGTCVLISRMRFEVQVGFSNALVELFKSMKTKQYNPQTKCWSFDLREYTALMKAVKSSLSGSVLLEPLPHPVLHTFKEHIKGNSTLDPNLTTTTTLAANLSHIDNKLVDALLPFQRLGVDFAVRQKGRLLLADDMGLGKTLQALCIAAYYRDEWPLLIVVPSSIRFAWKKQLLQWIPSADEADVVVLMTAKDNVHGGEVVIASYDLLVRSKPLQARPFNIVIMDECHSLKNPKTARTKAAMPILKNASRVILLSGTPALSRPSELYTQISAIDRRTFPNFQSYGVRYCNGKQCQWGWDYSGSSHMEELQIVLRENLMIRRLKKDVLKQLPSKRREMIVLNPSSIKGTKRMAAKAKELGHLKGMEQRGALLEYFHQSGTCKGPAVREYVIDLVEAGHKFLFFGHHQQMLDCLEDAIKKKCGYIRIDGRTSADQRNQLVERFQLRDDIQVAILSIMAANAGINLTTASLVIFGELFWNPGILVQAEDRVHRIGQEDSVNVRYLVAPGTADDYIWPLVQQKLSVLGKAGLSKDDFSNADTYHIKDKSQPDLMAYFEESFFDEVWEDEGCNNQPEFVDNPSPKKRKTPSKGRISQPALGSPPKLKQRTLFKFLTPTKQPPRDEDVAESSSSPSSLSTLGENTQSTQPGDHCPLVNSGVDTGEQYAMEGIDWFDDIPDSILDDMDFDEPSVKRSRTDP